MELIYSKIDTKTASREELLAELARLETLKNIFYVEEQTIKVLINSMYGALANAGFAGSNTAVAEAITLQGQDLIKYSEIKTEDYCRNHWHLDVETHIKMGITGAVHQISKPVAVYIDTDSLYVSFQEMIESCGWKGTIKDFILELYRHKLAGYLEECFETYAKDRNTENIQNFEMENISESGVWLAKKKYVLELMWKALKVDKLPDGFWDIDGLDYPRLKKIKYTGVEVVQGSTCKFAKKHLVDLIKYIFTNRKNFSITDFSKELKAVKDAFKISNIEDISLGSSINDYDKYVLNDTTFLEVAPRCPIHVRASGNYNLTLNQNKKYIGRYPYIMKGDKVKFYHVKSVNPEESVWGYPNGSFPIEIAPPIDMDYQFTKVILSPINRFVVAMGFNPLSDNLMIVNQLF